MKRTFEFNGSNGAGESMALVLALYSKAAYPVGGSDCAAASREALQSIADKLISSDYVDISTRQRPMMKSALKWFYSEMNNVEKNVKNSLEEVGVVSMTQEVYESLLSQLQR